MKRNFVAATVALALIGAASSAFAATGSTTTIKIKADITNNTCVFNTNTTTDLGKLPLATTELQAENDNGPIQKVEIPVEGCAQNAAENLAVQFMADASDFKGMALVDKTGGTGAGLKLFQDAAGTKAINPTGTSGSTDNLTAPVAITGTTMQVPVYMQAAKVDPTVTAGTIDAQALVGIAYP